MTSPNSDTKLTELLAELTKGDNVFAFTNTELLFLVTCMRVASIKFPKVLDTKVYKSLSEKFNG